MNEYIRAKLTLECEDGIEIKSDCIVKVIRRDPKDHLGLRAYNEDAVERATYCQVIPKTWFDFEGTTFPESMQITMREG